MKPDNIALITSAGGHGFMELRFAQAYGKEVVACSEKTKKEDFEKETADIFNRLSPFIPNMKIATWEEVEAEKYAKGISYRTELTSKKIDKSMWTKFAQATLSPKYRENLPKYNGLKTSKLNVMLIPQKLISDGKCGFDAKQQSVPLESFNFFKYEKNNNHILGQYFHNINDIELVSNIAKDFSMYVPGQNEHKEVFGIRNVPHDQFLNMFKQVDMSVGIAGTHTWYMLTCFPDIPQIILYQKNGPENWDEIAQAYREQGKPIYAMGFDENTNWKKFSLEMKVLYHKLSRTISRNKDNDNFMERKIKSEEFDR